MVRINNQIISQIYIMPSHRNHKLLLFLIIPTGLLATRVLYVAGLIHQLTLAAVIIGLRACSVTLFTYALRPLSRGLGNLCITAALSASVQIRPTSLGLIQLSSAGNNWDTQPVLWHWHRERILSSRSLARLTA